MSCLLGIKGRLHVRRKAMAELYGEGRSKTGVISIIRFRPEDIKAMTSEFSREKLVGESEFASVYKCSLPGEKIVAVKQLKPGAIIGEPKFMALIDTMNRAKHPNLNSLLGYCFTKDFQTLVFEFAENYDLSYHLHGKSGLSQKRSKPGLSWDIRFRIAKGVAHALSYLHNECHPQILHRDIKPANILLNNTFDAQVADFGFTKLEDKICPYVVTESIKTIGYVAPEYGIGDDLTDKSDVYSFGIILIQILTGRTPERKNSDPFFVFKYWAKERILDAFENDNFSGLVDPRLKGEYNKEEVYKMAKVILGCIKLKPEDRPTMAQALWILEGELDSDYSYVGRGTGISWDVNYNKLSYGEACSSSCDDGAKYETFVSC